LAVGANAAEAQSRFDLGLYGGWSWTSAWFESGDESFGIGSEPVVGAQATFWATPAFGVRLNGTYIPSSLPHAESSVAALSENRPVNNYFVDLEGVFRPMWSGDGSIMSSLYLWLGGGVMFANVADTGPEPPEDTITCVEAFFPNNTCLSYQPSYATVGQG